MRKFLYHLAFLLLTGTAVWGQTTVTGTTVQDGTGHLLNQGYACFSPYNSSGVLTPIGGSTGPFCFPVTGGRFSGSVASIGSTGLNYQLAVQNQTGGDLAIINWLVAITGPSWSFDTLIVPVSLNTAATATGTGSPYWGCSPGATFVSTTSTRTTWQCTVTNGYPTWFQTGNSPAPGPGQSATVPVVAQMIADAVGKTTPPTSGTAILKANGTGGFGNAIPATDYIAPSAPASQTITQTSGQSLSTNGAGLGYSAKRTSDSTSVNVNANTGLTQTNAAGTQTMACDPQTGNCTLTGTIAAEHVAVTGTPDGCSTWSAGVIGSTGVPCSSGGGTPGGVLQSIQSKGTSGFAGGAGALQDSAGNTYLKSYGGTLDAFINQTSPTSNDGILNSLQKSGSVVTVNQGYAPVEGIVSSFTYRSPYCCGAVAALDPGFGTDTMQIDYRGGQFGYFGYNFSPFVRGNIYNLFLNNRVKQQAGGGGQWQYIQDDQFIIGSGKNQQDAGGSGNWDVIIGNIHNLIHLTRGISDGDKINALKGEGDFQARECDVTAHGDDNDGSGEGKTCRRDRMTQDAAVFLGPAAQTYATGATVLKVTGYGGGAPFPYDADYLVDATQATAPFYITAQTSPVGSTTPGTVTVTATLTPDNWGTQSADMDTGAVPQLYNGLKTPVTVTINGLTSNLTPSQKVCVGDALNNEQSPILVAGIMGVTFTAGAGGTDGTYLSNAVGGGGSGAQVLYTITNGVVDSAFMQSFGTGYTSLPTFPVGSGTGTLTATAISPANTYSSGTAVLTAGFRFWHTANAIYSQGPQACHFLDIRVNSAGVFRNVVEVLGAKDAHTLMYSAHLFAGWVPQPDGLWGTSAIQPGTVLTRDASGVVSTTFSNFGVGTGSNGQEVTINATSGLPSSFYGSWDITEVDDANVTWSFPTGVTGAAGNFTTTGPAYFSHNMIELPLAQLMPGAEIVYAGNPATHTLDGSVQVEDNNMTVASADQLESQAPPEVIMNIDHETIQQITPTGNGLGTAHEQQITGRPTAGYTHTVLSDNTDAHYFIGDGGTHTGMNLFTLNSPHFQTFWNINQPIANTTGGVLNITACPNLNATQCTNTRNNGWIGRQITSPLSADVENFINWRGEMDRVSTDFVHSGFIKERRWTENDGTSAGTGWAMEVDDQVNGSHNQIGADHTGAYLFDYSGAIVSVLDALVSMSAGSGSTVSLTPTHFTYGGNDVCTTIGNCTSGAAANLAGGSAFVVPYQSAANTTAFTPAPSTAVGQYFMAEIVTTAGTATAPQLYTPAVLGIPTLPANNVWGGIQDFTAGGQSNGQWATAASTPATSSANQTSPFLSVQGNYWNGTVSVQDSWNWSDVLGTGTNPTSVLTLAHVGSTGASSISIPFHLAITTETATTNNTNAASTAFVHLFVGTSGTATAAVGTGVTSVTCATAACTNLRGTYTIVGGTATTGTIATLSWGATATAYACTVTQNGGTAFLGIGHGVATTTGMTITSGVTVAGVTVAVDYQCEP